MARFTSHGRKLDGSDLTHIPASRTIARFAGFVTSTHTGTNGDMQIRLGVPHDQIPHIMGLIKELGGVTFEITVRKVPFDQLPEPGW